MADEDIYSALIGGAPTDPQRQALLAQMLRDQAGQGRFLQASGDRVIAPLGQQMTEEAMRGATQISGEREREAQFKMMQEYRAAQEQNMVDKIAEAYGLQGMKGTTAERVANIKAGATLGAAEIRGEKGKQLAMGERKDLEQMANTTESLRGIIHDFKPEYAGVGTGMTNWMAQYGLGPDKWKQAQDWWSRYNREFSLNEIHRQFGARFTAPEQIRFEAAHINPNMNAQQIMEKLQSIEPHVTNMIRGEIHDYTAGGYDTKYLEGIKQRLGITDDPQTIPQPTGRGPHGGASSFPSGAQPAPYPTTPAAPATAPAPSSAPALKYLQSGPAYMMAPGAVPPRPQAPAPYVRPTPPMLPPGQQNLFQGLGGIPGG